MPSLLTASVIQSLPQTMRVPRFVGAGKIVFGETLVPEPGPGQLLVKVAANALCGEERGQYESGSDITPGHETAGVVVAAGEGTQTAVGTHGVIYLMDFCGECRSCRAGATNQCQAKRAEMGFNRDGGYAPYEVVSERIFFPIDADIPLADATLLLDVMGTGGHAIRRAQRLRPDIETVLVSGAGPVGLGVAAMCRLLLGDTVHVAVADVSGYRLELARTLGASVVDLRDETLPEGLGRNGMARVDVAIDTAGKAASRVEGLLALAPRGVLVCVGHGEALSIDVSPELIAPERAVLGSDYFPFDDLSANLQLYREHHDFIGRIITHRYGAGEIQTAFETFFSRQAGKVIVEQ